MPNPFGGARTEPAFGIWEVAVIGATSPSLNARADSAGTRAERNADLAVPFGSSCRPRAIFQRLCATRTVRLIERTEQPFLMAGSAPEDFRSVGFVPRKVSERREQCPLCGLNLGKGAAKMNRIRLSQPQSSKRRHGRTMAPSVTGFCSKGDDAVRDRVGPLR